MLTNFWIVLLLGCLYKVSAQKEELIINEIPENGKIFYLIFLGFGRKNFL